MAVFQVNHVTDKGSLRIANDTSPKKLHISPIHATIFHPHLGRSIQDGLPQIIIALIVWLAAASSMRGCP